MKYNSVIPAGGGGLVNPRINFKGAFPIASTVKKAKRMSHVLTCSILLKILHYKQCTSVSICILLQKELAAVHTCYFNDLY